MGGDPNVAPEVEHHGQQRAHMHGDIDREPLIWGAGEGGQQDEVARGRNGQELCHALNQRYYQKLKECHTLRALLCYALIQAADSERKRHLWDRFGPK